MGEPKFIIAGWCIVDPEKRDEAVEHFKDMVLRARKAPGCLDFMRTAMRRARASGPPSVREETGMRETSHVPSTDARA